MLFLERFFGWVDALFVEAVLVVELDPFLEENEVLFVVVFLVKILVEGGFTTSTSLSTLSCIIFMLSAAVKVCFAGAAADLRSFEEDT